ncbi:MAG: hypothetical protein ABIK92_19685 [Pseudomonadota bacterium]
MPMREYNYNNYEVGKKKHKTSGNSKVFWIVNKFVICSVLIAGIGQSMNLPKVIDKNNSNQYKDILVSAMYRTVEMYLPRIP